jgi:predicted O-methyltransferase YrrM
MKRSEAAGAAEMTPEEHELLLGLLRSERFDGAHLELGTAAGATLCAMLACLPEERGFIVVDRLRYFEGQREAVESSLARSGLDRRRVELRVASSARAWRTATAARERFDFMLIDAGQKLHDVTRDLRWTRLLRPGGIVCLHDYDDRWSHRGVRVAVDRFQARRPEYQRIGRAGTLLVLRKLAEPACREITAGDLAHAALLWLPLRLQRTAGKLAKRVRRRWRPNRLAQ